MTAETILPVSPSKTNTTNNEKNSSENMTSSSHHSTQHCKVHCDKKESTIDEKRDLDLDRQCPNVENEEIDGLDEMGDASNYVTNENEQECNLKSFEGAGSCPANKKTTHTSVKISKESQVDVKVLNMSI